MNSNDRYQQDAYNRTVVRPGTETSDRERLGDFYLYPIAGRTTIAASQTKQVSFLDAHGVPARRGYTFAVAGFDSAAEAQSTDSVIRFSASSNGGLGAALPAGTVRFYMRDSNGAPQFIGERAIGHTPMGSELELAVGRAFDVKVQAVRVSRDRLTEKCVDHQHDRYNRPRGATQCQLYNRSATATPLLAHRHALHIHQRAQ